MEMSEHLTTASPTLFRYDLILPPDEWSTNFFSPEPQYHDPIHGYKNQAGLFFFTDCIEIAHQIGTVAAERAGQDFYYLTTASTKEQLKLIDISGYAFAFHMIKALNSLGIDVMIPEFRTFEGENHFGQLIPDYEVAALHTSRINVSRVSVYTMHPDGSDASLFGQRLTDFGNGHKFKSLAKSAIPDCDGYKFTEYQDARGSTYCLFDSSKLLKIDRHKVLLNK